MGDIAAYEVEARFRDCDPAGIVFYGNFFAWFDDAAWAFMRAVAAAEGTELAGALFPLATVEADFRQAVRWNERLGIATAVLAVGGASFTLRHTAVVAGEARATCTEKRVFCRRDGDTLSAVRIPDPIRAGLAKRLVQEG